MADRRRYSYPAADTAEIPQFSSSSNHQSFSSTLLDAIYREIDRGDAGYPQKKPIDEKVADPAVDVKRLRKVRANYFSSSSADYGCGRGGYFEAESLPIRRPKAVRKGGGCEFHGDHEIDRRGFDTGEGFEQKSSSSALKQEGGGGFLKTKSRALKLYGELKKVKQPISPGGKLAGLWNSLLSTAAGGLKKPKLAGSAGYDSPSLKSTTTNTSSSTCSSASSFSRSCLSKTTPSSSSSTRTKTSAVADKRSVRFFPVSVIVDEDCQPCGHKALRDVVVKSTAIDDDLQVRIMKNKTDKKTESPFHHRYTKSESTNRAFDDELDGSSDSSSDLFELELDNLDGNRYGQQLPVYGTTDLRTTRAIANTNTSFVF